MHGIFLIINQSTQYGTKSKNGAAGYRTGQQVHIIVKKLRKHDENPHKKRIIDADPQTSKYQTKLNRKINK